MEELARIIADNETRLVRKVLAYAKTNGYVRYTSTLEHAWRLSVQGISRSLLAAVERFRAAPDFGPDDVFIKGANAIDPQGNAGILTSSLVGGTIGMAWPVVTPEL